MSIQIRTGKGSGAKVTVPLAAGALVCLGLGAGAAGASGFGPAGAGAAGPKAALASKAARATTVKGTIKGGSGMTLVLLSNAGKVAARKKLNSAGAISLGARAGYSLHLIGRDGAYAGPIVLATAKNGATVYQTSRVPRARLTWGPSQWLADTPSRAPTAARRAKRCARS